MLGYRKKPFMKAHALLQSLRVSPDNLIALRELQLLLLKEIVLAKSKIRNLKSQLTNNIGKEISKKRKTYLDNRIKKLRQCAYVWRCFGDAIAFLYMDKYALKHTFFNTENMKPKGSSGFITGKNGLIHELALLNKALEHNVPALLVDLTNTIRHGDVCLMEASDPYLIEVKASKKLDSRGKKQIRSINKLHAFYDTDSAENFRGLPYLRRRCSSIAEREYSEQLNECLNKALKKGFAICSPERGVHYVVMTPRAPAVEKILEPLRLYNHWVFFLNTEKSNQTWAPYTPFTLTIKDRDRLWDFIQGYLVITVFLELNVLSQIASKKGFEVKFDQSNEDYQVFLKPIHGEGQLGISSQLISRVAMECVSLEWLVLSSIEQLEQMMQEGGIIASS